MQSNNRVDDDRNLTSSFLPWWQRIFNPKFLIFIVLIIIFIIIEGVFDVIEIGLGEIVALTNSKRPRYGAIWEREINGEHAVERLQNIIQEAPPTETPFIQIKSLEDLVQITQKTPVAKFSKEDFLEFYSPLPYDLAQRIIPPYELLILKDNDNWQQCSVSRTEVELRIYLLDGEDQLIRDCYIPLASAENYSKRITFRQPDINEFEEFSGRVVAAKEFYQAFNSLPISTKIYIMNDPMQLIRWNDSLQKVGISRYIENGSVSIGFQVQSNLTRELFRFQASEIAASRLIERLNNVITDKFLSMPERKVESGEYEEIF